MTRMITSHYSIIFRTGKKVLGITNDGGEIAKLAANDIGCFKAKKGIPSVIDAL
jgi:hypothetical protein